MIDNITAFLAELEAVLPEDFKPTTAVDDMLEVIADDVSHTELVAYPANQNLEYSSKMKPVAKASVSDDGEALSNPSDFPLHRRRR